MPSPHSQNGLRCGPCRVSLQPADVRDEDALPQQPMCPPEPPASSTRSVPPDLAHDHSSPRTQNRHKLAPRPWPRSAGTRRRCLRSSNYIGFRAWAAQRCRLLYMLDYLLYSLIQALRYTATISEHNFLAALPKPA